MPLGKDVRVYAAPEPVLGLVASATNLEEARGRRTARSAMGYATAGALSGAIVSIGLLLEGTKKLPHSGADALLGLLLLLTPILTLIGFVLGILARKSRTGRVAITVSLIPLGLVVLFLVGAFVVGISIGMKKA